MSSTRRFLLCCRSWAPLSLVALCFFQKHGKKLLQSTVSVLQLNSNPPIFQHCPALTVLGIACDGKIVPSNHGFALSERHMTRTLSVSCSDHLRILVNGKLGALFLDTVPWLAGD
ncbi:hypothetical protein DFH09DRAFT_592357 [Mycena vulgaris]|nr:hypothetical protein DFH09DRAFT_592357 [Mycena vulgaris]